LNYFFMKKICLISLIILSGLKLSAQQFMDYGFQRNLTVKVKDSLLNYLADPWCGGLNSCQFGEIDLDQDGRNDLVIYDRSRLKLLTFINNGTANTVDYTYAPEYEDKFPPIYDWMEIADYNCDGKMDIYTSSNGGITVYKNISDPVNGLRFQLITYNIIALQASQMIPIFANSVDFPAFADIDGDGDIDILNFYILGNYVSYYKNLSMETYGNCDSLNYVLVDNCWGMFTQNVSNNKIAFVDTCVFNKNSDDKKDLLHPKQVEHAGSTLLATDLNGDGVMDLLLGCVGYPNIDKLVNAGTRDSARMTSAGLDTTFPSYSVPVSLMSFPAPVMMDVNNDGKKDFLVSSFEMSQTVSENLKSCWYYKNTGTASVPVFDYQYNNFLQKDMIDAGAGAYPVLADYDGDGLPDLFIGNYGVHDSSYYSFGSLYSTFRSRISLYKNIGTASNPEFQFVTNDFANIAHRKLVGVVPTFGDIDGDTAMEMIIGKSDGTLDLYDNTNKFGQPMNMVLAQTNYQGIHIGSFGYAAPQLVDLDGDGLLDLVIGDKAGTLYYYRNTGTKTNPVFTLVTDSLGGVVVCKHWQSNYGSSVPCFFKDSTNHFRLFVGSESGYIYYYKDIDNNLSGHFTLKDSMVSFIYEGYRSAVAVANLRNDTFPDMIVGNYGGGVTFYKGITPPPAGIPEYAQSNSITTLAFPNPADGELSIKFRDNITIETATVSIFNIIGQSVKCSTAISQGNIIVNTTSLDNGLYFFLMTGKNKNDGKEISGSGKFVVTH